jgi:hypothetical protein
MAAVKTTAPPLDTELLSALRVTGVPVALLAGAITVVTSRKRKSIPTKAVARLSGRLLALGRAIFVIGFSNSFLYAIFT